MTRMTPAWPRVIPTFASCRRLATVGRRKRWPPSLKRAEKKRPSCSAGVLLLVGLDEFPAKVDRRSSTPDTRIPIGKLENDDRVGVSHDGHFAASTINRLVFKETLTVESEK